ncbi:MAG: DUF2442 domain-containing protein [Bacteroidales bacterium]|nr:DUF2442 domain-containing protein [Bacteroidales bacterium]
MTLNEIERIWVDDESINIETKDGKKAKEKFCDYRRLQNATNEQRQNYKTNDLGLHWPDVDEDLSFDGFFNKRTSEIAELIKGNPIINASALARRLGIPQPLFAAYISGNKRPSLERIKAIKEEIRKVGRELAGI